MPTSLFELLGVNVRAPRAFIRRLLRARAIVKMMKGNFVHCSGPKCLFQFVAIVCSPNPCASHAWLNCHPSRGACRQVPGYDPIRHRSSVYSVSFSYIIVCRTILVLYFRSARNAAFRKKKTIGSEIELIMVLLMIMHLSKMVKTWRSRHCCYIKISWLHVQGWYDYKLSGT